MDRVYELKFSVKTLEKQAQRCESEATKEKDRAAKEVKKGNWDGARQRVQNVSRKRAERLKYLNLASRLDSMASQLDTHAKMDQVDASLTSAVASLTKSLDQKRLEQVTSTMEQLERKMEDMEVHTSQIMQAGGEETYHNREQEDEMLRELADQAGVEASLDVPSAAKAQSQPLPSQERENSQLAQAGAEGSQPSPDDDLSARLAHLRGKK